MSETTQNPSLALRRLADSRGQFSALPAIYNHDVDSLDEVNRATYLEGQRLGVIQFLVGFVKAHGETAPQGWIWSTSRSRLHLSLSIEVCRDSTIEVRAKVLDQTAEREVIVLSDVTPGKEMMIFGKGKWLSIVHEEYELAEQRRQHADRLRERLERDARIGDLTADV